MDKNQIETMFKLLPIELRQLKADDVASLTVEDIDELRSGFQENLKKVAADKILSFLKFYQTQKKTKK